MGAVGKMISSIRERLVLLVFFFHFGRRECTGNRVLKTRSAGRVVLVSINQLRSRRRVDYKFVYARQSFFVPEIKLTMHLKRRDRTVWQQRSTLISPIFLVLSTRMSAACTFPWLFRPVNN